MALVEIELRATATYRVGVTYDDQASRRYITQAWAEIADGEAITLVVWTTEDAPFPGRTASVTLVGPGRKTFAVPTGQAARLGAELDARNHLIGLDFATFGA